VGSYDHPMTKALVLAAGKSTRIAAVAQGKPKPLLEIGGAPVLGHNLALLSRHGVTEVWINLHHEAQMIRDAVGDGARWGVHVRYSFEETLLGTAGAVKKLEGSLATGTFLVLYGDNFTNCDVTALLRQHRSTGAAATVAVFDAATAGNSGIAGGTVQVDSSGRIQRFVEGAGAQQVSRLVNAGIYALEPSVAAEIPHGFSDFGKDIFPGLLAGQQHVHAFVMNGFCLALDTPESYAQAHRIHSQMELEAGR
jgi:mannose-1-phosphate guanylyltransferase